MANDSRPASGQGYEEKGWTPTATGPQQVPKPPSTPASPANAPTPKK